MRIFVAGAGGEIARRLLPQLIGRGHQVVAATPSADEVRALCALGAHGVVMDGLDAGSVGETVARAEPDAVIHLCFDEQSFRTDELQTTGNDHLLAAAAAVGVRRFVALDLDDAVSATVAVLERAVPGVYRVGVTGVRGRSSQRP